MKILVALDLKEGSAAILARAVQLTVSLRARLTVLHVVEADVVTAAAGASGLGEDLVRSALHREARTKLELLLSEAGYVERDTARIEFGSPHKMIAHLAQELAAGLLVVGIGTARSLMERIVGSTTDRIVRTVPIPVLVVGGASSSPYQRVAVAVDFSSESAAAARAARILAPNASLLLVHAEDIPAPFREAMLSAGSTRAQTKQYREARLAKAREALAEFARDLPGNTEARIVETLPGPALLELSGDADLLALGPHGHNAIMQALLGSVTQAILREARCDILIARDAGSVRRMERHPDG